jgi:hypothetical protein
LFSKFSLWSFKDINASRFFIRSILSLIPNLLEISFNSESISSIRSSDPVRCISVQWRFVNVKLYLHPVIGCLRYSFCFYFKHAAISIRLFTKEYSCTITGCLLKEFDWKSGKRIKTYEMES